MLISLAAAPPAWSASTFSATEIRQILADKVTRDRLLAQITGQGALELLPLGNGRFVYKDVEAEIAFAADGSSLTIFQGGATTEAPRKTAP